MAKPKVVVMIEGGIVTEVLSEVPLDVEVIDFDTECSDPDDEVMITLDGEEAFVYQVVVDVCSKKRTQMIHAMISEVRK